MFVSKTIQKHEKPDVPWTILNHNKVGVSYNQEATIITAAFYQCKNMQKFNRVECRNRSQKGKNNLFSNCIELVQKENK